MRRSTAAAFLLVALALLMPMSDGVPASTASGAPTFTGVANVATFEVYLEGFTENPDTENIGYVRMVIDLDGASPWTLNSEGIAGACAGWQESTGSGSINGPSVFMSAHDEHAFTYRNSVDYPLQDGRLFWIDCTATATGLSQIYFWNAPEIGDFGANQYPSRVELVELTASRAVFSANPVSCATSSIGQIKALYR
jgi:hypothetical protein